MNRGRISLILDLEDVGRDNYHHTFFEMLGNWSFGDYFKKEAVAYSYSLLTEVYGLPPDRLYATYFEGDAKQGLEPDLEAKQLWLDIGLPEDHIIPGNAKDNFWEMGETGPCGPCSEIHFDRIGGRNAAKLVNMDDPDVLEIWNNVFIQYNREADGKLRLLPNKHVDTGMGFERLVSVVQNKRSNYDTDVFSPIFAKIQELTNARPYAGKLGAEDTDGIDTAYRVVADHVRTLTIAISDGGVPSNEGRGYVLRRILRRGARFVRKKFDVQIGKFFSSLMDVVVEEMGEFFPEVKGRVGDVKEILDEEEESFSRTLDRGEKLFEDYRAKAKAENKTTLSGVDVWRLYDTYGFPVDLTTLMAEESGLGINQEEFEKARLESYEASKAGGKSVAGQSLKLDVHDIGKLEGMKEVPKTNDEAKYTTGVIPATVKAIYYGKEFTKSAEKTGETFGVILDKTNFYAEQGGQEYDTGKITIDGKAEFEVENVQTFAGYVLHIGSLKYGSLKVGDEVISTFDELRRWPIRNNHTGTHILNFALREVLGDHIDQKGSLVAAEKLRFDFSHKSGIPIPELTKIENICSEWVAKNTKVYSKEMSLAEAKQIPGLRAVFGEVYPDPVRVVSIEFDVNEIQKDVTNPKWRTTSIEFCGGTHVAKTGDIKEFVILEESGIAKGIRRIVAVTGKDAHKASRIANEFAGNVKALEGMQGAELETRLKTITPELDKLDTSAIRKAEFKDRIAKVQKAHLEADKKRTAAEQKAAVEQIKSFLVENPNATYYIGEINVGSNKKSLQAALLPGKTADLPIYLFSSETSSGQLLHSCLLPKRLVDAGVKAPEWAAAVSKAVGGKAGGKADGATGIGESSKVKAGIEAAESFIKAVVERSSVVN